MIMATTVWILESSGVAFGVGYGMVLFAVNLVLVLVVFFVLDRDRLVVGQRHLKRERRRA